MAKVIRVPSQAAADTVPEKVAVNNVRRLGHRETVICVSHVERGTQNPTSATEKLKQIESARAKLKSDQDNDSASQIIKDKFKVLKQAKIEGRFESGAESPDPETKRFITIQRHRQVMKSDIVNNASTSRPVQPNKLPPIVRKKPKKKPQKNADGKSMSQAVANIAEKTTMYERICDRLAFKHENDVRKVIEEHKQQKLLNEERYKEVELMVSLARQRLQRNLKPIEYIRRESLAQNCKDHFYNTLTFQRISYPCSSRRNSLYTTNRRISIATAPGTLGFQKGDGPIEDGKRNSTASAM